jgi:uncharacterized membrane protein
MHECTTQTLAMHTTIARMLDTVTLTAALGAAIIGGVFFAFSNFIMPGLARLTAAHGAGAMQAINVAVLNRWFLGVLLGVGGLCLVIAVAAALDRHAPGAGLRFAGAALYLVGTVGVTIACNVPRNEALQVVAPHGADIVALWDTYVREWTAWNTVRTAAAIAAAAALMVAPLLRR